MPQDSNRGVSRRRFLAGTGVAGAVALAGCVENTDRRGDTFGSGGGTGGSLSGRVVVKGSSTVFPVSDEIAEQFMAEHPNVNVTVDSTGSGGGFENWFCAGDADLNGASRPIQDGEVEQCSANDVEPVEFQVASDALTVAVNNDADWVDCVSFEELSQIWREGGAQSWSDVRDEWPDREFQLYGPASTSGTYDWFNRNVVGESVPHTTNHQPTEEDETIVQGIRDNPAGMGYFGYAYYSANSDDVKALAVETEGTDGCTEPSLSNAKDGAYPMARPLFVYAAESALDREEVAEFMRFYVENAETSLVEDIGYVPSSGDQREKNLETLDEATDT